VTSRELIIERHHADAGGTNSGTLKATRDQLMKLSSAHLARLYGLREQMTSATICRDGYEILVNLTPCFARLILLALRFDNRLLLRNR
jgi:hypothetical protein